MKKTSTNHTTNQLDQLFSLSLQGYGQSNVNFFPSWAVVKARQISRTLKLKIKKSNNSGMYCLMISVLYLCFALFLSIVSNSYTCNSLSVIFSYVHFRFTSGLEYCHSSICWHSSIRSHTTIRSPSSYVHTECAFNLY